MRRHSHEILFSADQMRAALDNLPLPTATTTATPTITATATSGAISTEGIISAGTGAVAGTGVGAGAGAGVDEVWAAAISGNDDGETAVVVQGEGDVELNMIT